MARLGGIIELKINGTQYRAKGDYTYGLGTPKRDAIIGSDGVHGFRETPQVPFIEGEITDGPGVDMKSLLLTQGATVYLRLGNGKIIALRDAYQAGEGTTNTGEGNAAIRFEGASAEEI